MVRSATDHRARFRLGVLALIVAAALGGCGRKGPLELPPTVPETQTPGAAAAQTNRVSPIVDDPGLMQPPGTYYKQERSAATQNLPGPINAPAPPKPGRPFILDPLL